MTLEQIIITSIIEESPNNNYACLHKKGNISLYKIVKPYGNGVPYYLLNCYYIVFSPHKFNRFNDYNQALSHYVYLLENGDINA
mgnify:CR=1 FL=1